MRLLQWKPFLLREGKVLRVQKTLKKYKDSCGRHIHEAGAPHGPSPVPASNICVGGGVGVGGARARESDIWRERVRVLMHISPHLPRKCSCHVSCKLVPRHALNPPACVCVRV